MNKQRVLVLGGTGAIGVHLIDCLRDTEYAVIVSSRRERHSEGNITYVKGNAHDLEFLKELLIEHYTAIVNFMTYTSEEFNYVAPLLLDATDQYFFLSSCRTFVGSDNVITEESPQLLDVCPDKEYLATDNYALAKAKQERVLTTSGKKNWTIVRPYLTYSEQRLQLGFFEQNAWLMRAILGKTIVFSEDMASKYTTLTYGKDVANAIYCLIGNEKAYGEAINVTSGQCMKWSEVLAIYTDELEKCLGRKINVKILSKAPIDDWPTEKWTYLYDRLYNRQFCNQKLLSVVGSITFTESEEGLRHCIREFVKNPNKRGFTWTTQAYFDKITGEWYSRKNFSSLQDYCSYLTDRLLSKRTINKIIAIKKHLIRK